MAKPHIPLEKRKRHGTKRARQLAFDFLRPRFSDSETIEEIRARIARGDVSKCAEFSMTADRAAASPLPAPKPRKQKASSGAPRGTGATET